MAAAAGRDVDLRFAGENSPAGARDMRRDRSFMARCFELAEEARARGDTPVGSLIVGAGGEILAEASERNRTADLFAHAELLAVRRAVRAGGNKDLGRCALYTTNEPCFLCSFAIRQTAIARVVIAERTPHIGGASSQYPILTARDISVWGDPPEIVFLADPRPRGRS